MGKLIIMVPTPKGVVNLLNRTDALIEFSVFKYKLHNSTFNLKMRSEFTVENDGIHFYIFEDEIVISFSLFDSINFIKLNTHEYFK